MLTWHAHENAVTALAFGPDGRFLVSAGGDNSVRMWDPLSGVEQARIVLRHSLAMVPDRAHPLRKIFLSCGGEHVAVHRERSGLIFVDRAAFRVFATQWAATIVGPCLGPDGASVLGLVESPLMGMRKCVQYSLADGSVADLPRVVDWSARAIAFAPDGSQVAIGRQLWHWPSVDSSRGTNIDMKRYEPEDLAFSADNQHLFALVGGKIVVYGLPGGLYRTKLKGHNGRITAMALTPDGSRLWTASRDATVKCWDTHALTLDRTYTFQTGGLDCLAVSPDGNVAAVGSGQKGTITLWDLG